MARDTSRLARFHRLRVSFLAVRRAVLVKRAFMWPPRAARLRYSLWIQEKTSLVWHLSYTGGYLTVSRVVRVPRLCL